MPIPFTCPSCGKSTTVADQYAGQTGPCAACGQLVTVPGTISGSYAAPAVAGGAGMAVGLIVVLVVVALLAVAVCIGVPLAILLPAISQARGAAKRMQSSNNIKQIMVAMHTYHDVYNELPPAIVQDAQGKPLYSGMVLLLPYLGQDGLYQQFDRSQSWDSPANRHLSEAMLTVFKNPASPNTVSANTDYLFVGGPNSILGKDGRRALADITDGTSNTLLLVEVKSNTGSWAEPKVWTPDMPFDSDTPGVVNVGMADGSVRAVNRTINPQMLRQLADPADGAVVQLP